MKTPPWSGLRDCLDREYESAPLIYYLFDRYIFCRSQYIMTRVTVVCLHIGTNVERQKIITDKVLYFGGPLLETELIIRCVRRVPFECKFIWITHYTIKLCWMVGSGDVLVLYTSFVPIQDLTTCWERYQLTKSKIIQTLFNGDLSWGSVKQWLLLLRYKLFVSL